MKFGHKMRSALLVATCLNLAGCGGNGFSWDALNPFNLLPTNGDTDSVLVDETGLNQKTKVQQTADQVAARILQPNVPQGYVPADLVSVLSLDPTGRGAILRASAAGDLNVAHLMLVEWPDEPTQANYRLFAMPGNTASTQATDAAVYLEGNRLSRLIQISVEAANNAQTINLR